MLDAHLRQDFRTHRAGGEKFPQRISERELPFLRELQHRDRRGHLVHRAEVELRVLGVADAEVLVGVAEGGAVEGLSRLGEKDGSGEGVASSHALYVTLELLD